MSQQWTPLGPEVWPGSSMSAANKITTMQQKFLHTSFLFPWPTWSERARFRGLGMGSTGKYGCWYMYYGVATFIGVREEEKSRLPMRAKLLPSMYCWIPKCNSSSISGSSCQVNITWTFGLSWVRTWITKRFFFCYLSLHGYGANRALICTIICS